MKWEQCLQRQPLALYRRRYSSISIVAILPVFAIMFALTMLFSFSVGLFSRSSALKAHPLPVGSVAALMVIALYAVVIAIMLRLSPLLPARAVGDRDRTFKETWRQTRGNTWRLFWGLLACVFVPMVVIQIVILTISGLPSLGAAGERRPSRALWYH